MCVWGGGGGGGGKGRLHVVLLKKFSKGSLEDLFLALAARIYF